MVVHGNSKFNETSLIFIWLPFGLKSVCLKMETSQTKMRIFTSQHGLRNTNAANDVEAAGLNYALLEGMRLYIQLAFSNWTSLGYDAGDLCHSNTKC